MTGKYRVYKYVGRKGQAYNATVPVAKALNLANSSRLAWTFIPYWMALYRLKSKPMSRKPSNRLAQERATNVMPAANSVSVLSASRARLSS
jgi:hypothetical protein